MSIKRTLLMAIFLHALVALALTEGVAAKPKLFEQRPCSSPGSNANPAVRVWEQRSPSRLDENLLETDGLDYQRDIVVYACDAARGSRYIVRAWVRPKDGQWREIRIDDLTQDQKSRDLMKGLDYENKPFAPAKLGGEGNIADTNGVYARLTIPIRREGLRIGDNVRVEVRGGCESDDPSRYPVCPVEVVNSFLTIDKYGLLSGFTDSVLFVKRLQVTSKELGAGIDPANYRVSPGLNFGLTYLHRKHAFLQFLEPGFGFNVSLVNWKDQTLTTTGQLVQPTDEPVEFAIGAMGSMFDNVLTVVAGWNTNVAHDRTFVGVGFSVVGVVRKVARSSH